MLVIYFQGGRFAIYSECPPQLSCLITKCWQTLPEARPSFNEILADLIEFYIGWCMYS